MLRPTGTLWVVISDTYSGSGGAGGDYGPGGIKDGQPKYRQGKSGLPSKSLCMVPARFAIAMIDAGWILRSEIIWAKSVSLSETDSGNCMPESVSDRPTGSHEKIFMFAKEGRYYYDQDAVREPLRESSISEILRTYKRINQSTFDSQTGGAKDYGGGENPNMSARKTLENFAARIRKPAPEDPRSAHGSYKEGHSGFFDKDGNLLTNLNGRNLRNIWRINIEPCRIPHYAAYPTKLVQVILDLACPKRVCVKCGAPWEPQSAKTDIVNPSSKGSRFDRGKTAEHQMGRMQDGERYLKVSAGYSPGCKCEAGFVPGVVLDPFAGSGTTLVVAKRLGLNYIGLELSERYCEIIRRRLADEIVSMELFP